MSLVVQTNHFLEDLVIRSVKTNAAIIFLVGERHWRSDLDHLRNLRLCHLYLWYLYDLHKSDTDHLIDGRLKLNLYRLLKRLDHKDLECGVTSSTTREACAYVTTGAGVTYSTTGTGWTHTKTTGRDSKTSAVSNMVGIADCPRRGSEDVTCCS